MHVDERIARLAGRQHGLVTTGQLRRLGLGRGAVGHRRATGRLHSVHRGVLAVGHAAISEDAHLLAAVMACGSEAVLSHEHAAHLWGLLPPWARLELSPIHVTVPPACARGRRAGVAVHRIAIGPGERKTRNGVPVTSVARTLVDLGTRVELRALERAVDQALTDRLVTVRGLRAAVANGASQRTGALRTLLDAAERLGTVTRSQLEEAFLGLVRGGGLPEPRLNEPIAGLRVDAAWPRERIAVELDGYRWHRTRRRIESDRDREAKLRREGWTPVRYSARQVFDEPLTVLADVATVLAERRHPQAR